VGSDRLEPILEGIVALLKPMSEQQTTMQLEQHAMREMLPSVVVGHVITPSGASRDSVAVNDVLGGLELAREPLKSEFIYKLPTTLEAEKKWHFNFKWPGVSGNAKKSSSSIGSADTQDDRVLERSSYVPVLGFLRQLDFMAEDVSEGSMCPNKLLFCEEIYTCRKKNPFHHRGQAVFHKHRIEGRTDIVLLGRDRGTGGLLRHMVSVAVEIKTVAGYNASKDACTREAMLQLIGLNAFNTARSPTVVLSNLAKTHRVLYLAQREVETWKYVVKEQVCASFAAAIHFAKAKADEGGISDEFARPPTPPSSGDH
jgi:hypothetical protein